MDWLSIVSIAVSVIGIPCSYWYATMQERKKQKSIVSPVTIKAREVKKNSKESDNPIILIATFGGLNYRDFGIFSETDYDKLLEQGDWEKLGVTETTPGIGQTIKAIESYPNLKEVYLITTRNDNGRGSFASRGLLERYVKGKLHHKCEIRAKEEDFSVKIDEDLQVIEDTFKIVEKIFISLQGTYKPSQILVDVSGGLRGMTIGALLACSRHDQDINIIWAKYGVKGQVVENFPVMINFEFKNLKE